MNRTARGRCFILDDNLGSGDGDGALLDPGRAAPAAAERNARLTRALVALVLSGAFTIAILHRGIPMLRHDWSWPTADGALRAQFGSFFVGWDASGFGLSHPVIGPYGVALAGILASYLVPSVAVLAALVFLAGMLLTLGAMATLEPTDAAHGPLLAQIGIAVFALANPWVYDEMVAGHLFMVLACGATLWLLAGAWQRERFAGWLLLALVALAQLQFWVVLACLLGPFCIARRTWHRLWGGLALVVPAIVALALNGPALARVPVLDFWVRVQSVVPWQALSLRGYFAGYDAGFSGVVAYALYATAALFIASCIVPGASRRLRAWMLAAAVAIVLVVSGSKGPLAGPVLWALLHVRPFDIFRELFDLLGFLLILYVIGIARFAQRARAIAVALILIDALLLVAWVRKPIDSWWVPSRDVPRVHASAPLAYRFALAPEFQPLSYRRRGSGVDPDAFVTSSSGAPLNAYAPSEPATRALAAFARSGDVRGLAALGVTTVISRPYFSSAVPLPQRPTRVIPNPIPLFSTLARAPVVAVPPDLGAGQLFFGDLPGKRDLRLLQGDQARLNPSDAWVAAWLAFRAHPSLAQPYGGAYTTSQSARLSVSGEAVLGAIEGRLFGATGAPLATSTHGYQWISLAKADGAVRCDGVCLLAFEGTPPKLPRAAAPQPWFAASFVRYPLNVAVVSVERGSVLRYNTSFDQHWSALSLDDRRLLSHVRIDGSANAWFLSPETRRVVVFDWLSLVEALLTALALAFVATCVVRDLLRVWRAMRDSRIRRRSG